MALLDQQVESDEATEWILYHKQIQQRQKLNIPYTGLKHEQAQNGVPITYDRFRRMVVGYNENSRMDRNLNSRICAQNLAHCILAKCVCYSWVQGGCPRGDVCPWEHPQDQKGTRTRSSSRNQDTLQRERIHDVITYDHSSIMQFCVCINIF